MSFVNHLNAIALIIAIDHTTTTPPANTGLVDNFKVSQFPASLFKKSIKRDASIFTTFKEGKHWNTWHMNSLGITRVQDTAEVLNPDHCPVTND